MSERVDDSMKYAIEIKYYHQREYHLSAHYFRTKRDMNIYINNLGSEEKLLRKYKLTYKRLK